MQVVMFTKRQKFWKLYFPFKILLSFSDKGHLLGTPCISDTPFSSSDYQAFIKIADPIFAWAE